MGLAHRGRLIDAAVGVLRTQICVAVALFPHLASVNIDEIMDTLGAQLVLGRLAVTLPSG